MQIPFPVFSWSPFSLASTSFPFQCRFLKPDHFPRLRAVSWAARGLEGGGGGERGIRARACVHACGRSVVEIAPRPGQIPAQTLGKHKNRKVKSLLHDGGGAGCRVGGLPRGSPGKSPPGDPPPPPGPAHPTCPPPPLTVAEVTMASV